MRALRRVRVRVTLTATLVALAVVGLGSVLFVSTLRSQLESGLVSSSMQQVAQVQAQLSNGESPQQAVVSGKNDVVVQIVDKTGRVVATDHERVILPLRTTDGTARGVRVHGLEDQYVVVARRARGGSGALIVVARSSEQVGQAGTAAALLLAGSVPLGLALLAATIWFSVGRALRPVEAMRREAATIEGAHLEARLLVPPGDDEIPRLAVTLNQMLDRIDDVHQSQRQFVSDASHELRSPLTVLRQLGELGRADPGTAVLASEVLAEELRMEGLVAALLVLARLDDGGDVALRPVDLDDLVLEQAGLLRGDDLPRFDLAGVSAGQVEGDPVLLGQLVRNLLTNALRHAERVVRVELGESEGRVRLVVGDDGAGIAVEDRERIFARFVRLDESRSRDVGGSGLGLAIVAKVADRFGGRVLVDSAPEGGARFTIELPASV